MHNVNQKVYTAESLHACMKKSKYQSYISTSEKADGEIKRHTFPFTRKLKKK